MAGSALSRNRGLIFFIFSLLSLVYVANSLSNKELLVNLLASFVIWPIHVYLSLQVTTSSLMVGFFFLFSSRCLYVVRWSNWHTYNLFLHISETQRTTSETRRKSSQNEGESVSFVLITCCQPNVDMKLHSTTEYKRNIFIFFIRQTTSTVKQPIQENMMKK